MFETMKICSRKGQFKLMRVNHSVRSGGHNRDIFFIFFTTKVCFVYSLESPQRGDSNEYTQYMYTIFNIKKKIALNYSKNAAIGFFSK